jgi:hypothetical protein
LLVVDDLKKGYYLLFIDGGKRANERGQAEGAIGVILQEPDCGPVLATVAEKVGPVGSPHEAMRVDIGRVPSARVPLEVMSDTIQPFPSFYGIYEPALTALRMKIADMPPPVEPMAAQVASSPG